MRLKMSAISALLFLLISLWACGPRKPQTGEWKGVIHTQGQQIPFHFNLNLLSDGQYQVEFINGGDKMEIDSVSVRGDSIYIPILIFDAYIRATVKKGKMVGQWVKPYADDFVLPFEADFGQSRFPIPHKSNMDFSGTWEVVFTDQRGSFPAIGVFEQKGNSVTGTFLTNHGDYRFLEGMATGDSLILSLFDGTNAYLFKSKAIGANALEGEFYSGKTGFRTWSAQRNQEARLDDPSQITSMKEGHSNLRFAFPNLEGRLISLEDSHFDNKAIIVQILGTWCINCMDETKFLAQWYKENQERPVEIIGLAFERKDDIAYARQQLSRYIERFDVRYPILFAGANNRENLEKALPMIDRVSAFPTTIFLDKNKNVRKIHTGFSGPGTGKYYERFVEEFKTFMNELIDE